MDANNLNSTDNTQTSQNPQQAPAPGASNAEDFQSTAPAETLNEKTDNLTVQDTGDPIQGSQPVAAEAFPLGWVIGIGLTIVIGVVVLYKLLKETAEEAALPAAPPAAATKPKTTAKPVKKTAAKKKSNPNQRRKKSNKKRR